MYPRELKCRVVRMEYDFKKYIGYLHMPEGNCCDMQGCIGFFEKIDPAVRAIKTYAGYDPDTEYRRIEGDWKAISRR